MAKATTTKTRSSTSSAKRTSARSAAGAKATSGKKPTETATQSDDFVMGGPLAEGAQVAADANAASETNASGEDNMLRRQDLFERVAELTGERKNKIRPVIEATLAALGEALSQERDAALKPLGRVTVKRVEKGDNGTIIQAKIKYQPEEAGQSDKDGDDD